MGAAKFRQLRGAERVPHTGYQALLACLGLGLITACSSQLGTRAHSSEARPMPSSDSNLPGSMSAAPSTGGAPSLDPSAPPNTPGQPLTFSCNASAKAPIAVLRRLTLTQYQNTLRDLIATTAGASQVNSVIQALGPTLSRLPKDQREPVPQDLHGSYRRLDQSVQQSHVDGFYSVGIAMGAALTAPALLGTTVGACATDTDANNDASCLENFIRSFGETALRRKLSDDEVTFYKSVYGSGTAPDPQAYADVIGVMLNAPDFLYFVEHGATPVTEQPGTYELTASEMAARLSYQLWQTAPDAELRAKVSDASLLDPLVYQTEVARLIEDPRAQPTLSEFWADWMKVSDLPALDAKVSDPVFRAFAADDLPGASLKQSMTDDVLGLVNYYSWTQPSGLGPILTTDLSFAQAPELAKIYGTPTWNGTGAPPTFAPGQRPGLLTRALFLSTGSANTRPIMKGVYIRKNVLCDAIPPPPPGAGAKPPELQPGLTTRETVSQITEQPGTVCAGCHANIINPLGFSTENFDSLGRYRTEQRLFDAAGAPTGQKPVDTLVTPQVILGDTRTAKTPAELMALVQESTKVEACMARNFFRFTYARWEDESVDGCALEDARRALLTGTIKDMLKAASLTPAFKRRTFE